MVLWFAPAVLLASLAAAQEKPMPYVETIDVRIINVDAVVTDRKGRPVHGLTKDDFELIENGHQIPITNFFEVKPSEKPPQTDAAPAETQPVAEQEPVEERRRRIVLFVDESTLHPFNRNRIFPALDDFVRQAMRPSDEVMIVSWNHDLKIELPFTTDVNAAHHILERLSSTTTSGAERVRRLSDAQERVLDVFEQAKMMGGEKPLMEEGLREARQYADAVFRDERATTGAMNALMASMAAVDGKKILVFMTESLPAQPGLEMFEFIDGIRERFKDGRSRSAISDANRYSAEHEIQSISDIANASGFTIYPIQAGSSASDGAADVNPRLEMDMQIAVRGASNLKAVNDAQPLRALASATGGIAVVGSKNFELALDTIRKDFSSYYSLGYRASGEKVDRVRSLEVRVKNPDYRVRSRRSLVERSLESDLRDAVAANLFYPARGNEMKIALHVGAPRVSGRKMSMPLEIVIPMDSLTLIPDGDDLTGQFDLYIGFLRKDGSVSKVDKRHQQFRFAASAAERRKEVRLVLQLSGDVATSRISVGVLDFVSHSTGFAAQSIIGSSDQDRASNRR